MSENEKSYSKRNLHGRRIGRSLSQERLDLLANFLPKIKLNFDPEQSSQIKIDEIFEQSFSQIWFEIGFGDGDAIAHLHQEYPDIGFIGCEPFLNGITSLLLKVKDHDTDNLKIWDDDALVVLDKMPDNSIDRLYILNPDPWHKNRHHKRRIVREETLNLYARVLKSNSKLIATTDVPYLGDWMLNHLMAHKDFEPTPISQDDWQTPPAGWVQTAYERKKAKGADKMRYFIFERL